MAIAEELRKSYVELLGSISGLRVKQMLQPETIGKWSVRDVLLHIAMWDGEVLKALAIRRSGHEVDWSYVEDTGGIRKFNDFWISNMKHLSVKKVIRMLEIHHACIEAEVSSILSGVSKKSRSVPKWVRQITVDHYKAHTRKLKAYRKALDSK